MTGDAPDRELVETAARRICIDEISALAYARGVIRGLRAGGFRDDQSLSRAVEILIEHDEELAVGVAFLDLAQSEMRGGKAVN